MNTIVLARFLELDLEGNEKQSLRAFAEPSRRPINEDAARESTTIFVLTVGPFSESSRDSVLSSAVLPTDSGSGRSPTCAPPA